MQSSTKYGMVVVYKQSLNKWVIYFSFSEMVPLDNSILLKLYGIASMMRGFIKGERDGNFT